MSSHFSHRLWYSPPMPCCAVFHTNVICMLVDNAVLEWPHTVGCCLTYKLMIKITVDT